MGGVEIECWFGFFFVGQKRIVLVSLAPRVFCSETVWSNHVEHRRDLCKPMEVRPGKVEKGL